MAAANSTSTTTRVILSFIVFSSENSPTGWAAIEIGETVKETA